MATPHLPPLEIDTYLGKRFCHCGAKLLISERCCPVCEKKACIASGMICLRHNRVFTACVPRAHMEAKGESVVVHYKGVEKMNSGSVAADAPARGELNVGRKDDAGKLRYTLLPIGALTSIVRVLEFGARKYGADNWRMVDDGAGRYTEALLRHIMAYLEGERLDPESGLPHLAHAGCCILFILEFDRKAEITVLARAPGVSE